MPVRGLYLNPASGMAGDMFLGALVDAGLPIDALREGLATLPLEGFRLEVGTVMRGAVRATKVDVMIRRADGREVREARGEHDHQGGHVVGHEHRGDHEHGHDHGASYREILDIIGGSGLSDAVKARAAEIFHTVAVAESRVHGVSLEDVHFHEVGMVDSIVDVCGAALAVELLGVDEVVCSEIGIGTGVRRMAHGEMPLPVPATAEILPGMPVRLTGIADELLTPTGAAILKCLVTGFQPTFDMRVLACGYGAGSTERADPPNVVRALLYERGGDAAAAGHDRVVLLETHVDDMTPEALGHLRDRLESEGALDVLVQPVQMKKNRPGHLVTVICGPAGADRLEELLFRESTTFGIRRRACDRRVLDREIVEVETPWGRARVKIGRLGGEVVRIAPEYEDCARLAREAGRSLADVMGEVSSRVRRG